MSFRSQHVRLVALRCWFRWLTRQNLILHNPASEIELPRRIAQTFPGVWIYEECITGQGEKRVEINFHEFSAAASANRQAE